jgi:hypothetical protein
MSPSRFPLSFIPAVIAPDNIHLAVIAAARVVRPGICGRSVMSRYGTTACGALSGINEGVIGFALQQIQLSTQAARADLVVASVDVQKWPPKPDVRQREMVTCQSWPGTCCSTYGSRR